MKFTNLPSWSDIKIYTLSGKLVRRLNESEGEISWDGKNLNGQQIAPGLYIYVIEDEYRNKKIGKLAVSK